MLLCATLLLMPLAAYFLDMLSSCNKEIDALLVMGHTAKKIEFPLYSFLCCSEIHFFNYNCLGN